MHEYGVALTKLDEVSNADCIIMAVAHNEFKSMSLDAIKELFNQLVFKTDRALAFLRFVRAEVADGRG